MFAVQRALKGDWLGALGEATSGLASTIPGLGTAASLAIDGALIAKDVASEGQAQAKEAQADKAKPAPLLAGPLGTETAEKRARPAPLLEEPPGAESAGLGSAVKPRADATPAPLLEEPPGIEAARADTTPALLLAEPLGIEAERKRRAMPAPFLAEPPGIESPGLARPGLAVAQDREQATPWEAFSWGQAPAHVPIRPETNVNVTVKQTVNLAQGMTEPGIKQVLNEGRVELERHLEGWFENYLARRQEVSFA